MSKRTEVGGRIHHAARVHRLLRTVPPEQGFHFYEDIGKPTPKIAHSLEEFANIIQTIDVSAIDFHFHRGDFEKWFSEVIRDDVMSERISTIDKDKHGEELKHALINDVWERLEELRKTDPAYSIGYTHK